MKIIKNIRSSQEQEVVSIYPTETHVLVNKREVTIDSMDGVATLQYEYDCVVVENAQMYADVVGVATQYYNTINKAELLDKIIVTTTSGIRFYADDVSRNDLSNVLLVANSDADTTIWKTPDGWKLVTVADVKEALRLGLEEKGRIIGAINV
jgi:hypothetical protein